GRRAPRHRRHAVPRGRGEDRRRRRDPLAQPRELPRLPQGPRRDRRGPGGRLAAHRRHRRARRGRLPEHHGPQEGHPHHRRREERSAAEDREPAEVVGVHQRRRRAGRQAPLPRRAAGAGRGQRAPLGRRAPDRLLDLHRPHPQHRGRGADRGRGRARQRHARPRRDDQALRDPAQAPLPRGRRGHGDAEGQARQHRGALRRPRRGAVRVTDEAASEAHREGAPRGAPRAPAAPAPATPSSGSPPPSSATPARPPRRYGRQSLLYRDRYEQDLRLIRGTARWVGAAVVAAALIALPLVCQGYVVYNVTLFFFYALVAVSLAVLVGMTRQLSLGHAGFLAAGAYAQVGVAEVSAALIALPSVAQGYVVYNVTLFFVYALVAVSLVVLVGMTEQVSREHAGSLAAGAYAQVALPGMGVHYVLTVAAAVLL